jgi:periplasmic divalent cation tolerance protein
MNQDEVMMVLTHVPDSACANLMAEALINGKLAACVNILSPCVSLYMWQQQLERSTEIPMMIKTTRHAYPALQATLLKLHPYELPEIITLHVDGGLPAYLQWVSAQISQQSQP